MNVCACLCRVCHGAVRVQLAGVILTPNYGQKGPRQQVKKKKKIVPGKTAAHFAEGKELSIVLRVCSASGKQTFNWAANGD